MAERAGVWEVMLGGAFTPYAPEVQTQLEAAWRAGAAEVEVVLRPGATYVISLRHPMAQRQRADATKSRACRRVPAHEPADDESGAQREPKRPRHPASEPAPAATTSGSASASASALPVDPPLAGARFGFRLNRLHEAWDGLVPAAANRDTVRLSELLSADALRGVRELHIHNFMVDLDFMLAECPTMLDAGRKVVLLCGDRQPGQTTECAGRVHVLQPPHEPYGTHHSKARVAVVVVAVSSLLLFYRGCGVAVALL